MQAPAKAQFDSGDDGISPSSSNNDALRKCVASLISASLRVQTPGKENGTSISAWQVSAGQALERIAVSHGPRFVRFALPWFKTAKKEHWTAELAPLLKALAKSVPLLQDKSVEFGALLELLVDVIFNVKKSDQLTGSISDLAAAMARKKFSDVAARLSSCFSPGSMPPHALLYSLAKIADEMQEEACSHSDAWSVRIIPLFQLVKSDRDKIAYANAVACVCVNRRGDLAELSPYLEQMCLKWLQSKNEQVRSSALLAVSACSKAVPALTLVSQASKMLQSTLSCCMNNGYSSPSGTQACSTTEIIARICEGPGLPSPDKDLHAQALNWIQFICNLAGRGQLPQIYENAVVALFDMCNSAIEQMISDIKDCKLGTTRVVAICILHGKDFSGFIDSLVPACEYAAHCCPSLEQLEAIGRLVCAMCIRGWLPDSQFKPQVQSMVRALRRTIALEESKPWQKFSSLPAFTAITACLDCMWDKMEQQGVFAGWMPHLFLSHGAVEASVVLHSKFCSLVSEQCAHKLPLGACISAATLSQRCAGELQNTLQFPVNGQSTKLCSEPGAEESPEWQGSSSKLNTKCDTFADYLRANGAGATSDALDYLFAALSLGQDGGTSTQEIFELLQLIEVALGLPTMHVPNVRQCLELLAAVQKQGACPFHLLVSTTRSLMKLQPEVGRKFVEEEIFSKSMPKGIIAAITSKRKSLVRKRTALINFGCICAAALHSTGSLSSAGSGSSFTFLQPHLLEGLAPELDRAGDVAYIANLIDRWSALSQYCRALGSSMGPKECNKLHAIRWCAKLASSSFRDLLARSASSGSRCSISTKKGAAALLLPCLKTAVEAIHGSNAEVVQIAISIQVGLIDLLSAQWEYDTEHAEAFSVSSKLQSAIVENSQEPISYFAMLKPKLHSKNVALRDNCVRLAALAVQQGVSTALPPQKSSKEEDVLSYALCVTICGVWDSSSIVRKDTLQCLVRISQSCDWQLQRGVTAQSECLTGDLEQEVQQALNDVMSIIQIDPETLVKHMALLTTNASPAEASALMSLTARCPTVSAELQSLLVGNLLKSLADIRMKPNNKSAEIQEQTICKCLLHISKKSPDDLIRSLCGSILPLSHGISTLAAEISNPHSTTQFNAGNMQEFIFVEKLIDIVFCIGEQNAFVDTEVARSPVYNHSSLVAFCLLGECHPNIRNFPKCLQAKILISCICMEAQSKMLGDGVSIRSVNNEGGSSAKYSTGSVVQLASSRLLTALHLPEPAISQDHCGHPVALAHQSLNLCKQLLSEPGILTDQGIWHVSNKPQSPASNEAQSISLLSFIGIILSFERSRPIVLALLGAAQYALPRYMPTNTRDDQMEQIGETKNTTHLVSQNLVESAISLAAAGGDGEIVAIDVLAQIVSGGGLETGSSRVVDLLCRAICRGGAVGMVALKALLDMDSVGLAVANADDICLRHMTVSLESMLLTNESSTRVRVAQFLLKWAESVRKDSQAKTGPGDMAAKHSGLPVKISAFLACLCHDPSSDVQEAASSAMHSHIGAGPKSCLAGNNSQELANHIFAAPSHPLESIPDADGDTLEAVAALVRRPSVVAIGAVQVLGRFLSSADKLSFQAASVLGDVLHDDTLGNDVRESAAKMMAGV